MKTEVTIHFLNGNNLDIQNHYTQKEYRNDIVLQINSKYYEVFFFVEDVLRYEMTKEGYFSVPGLIILDDISNTKIFAALKHLVKIGYFKQFVGYNEIPYEEGFLNKWYQATLTNFDKNLLVSQVIQLD